MSTDQNHQIKSKLFSRFITFVLIALCCLFLLPACDTDPGYSSGKELRGVIVNADTGEPIPDAIVVADWITFSCTPGGGGLVCFYVGEPPTVQHLHAHNQRNTIPVLLKHNIYHIHA